MSVMVGHSWLGIGVDSMLRGVRWWAGGRVQVAGLGGRSIQVPFGRRRLWARSCGRTGPSPAGSKGCRPGPCCPCPMARPWRTLRTRRLHGRRVEDAVLGRSARGESSSSTYSAAGGRGCRSRRSSRRPGPGRAAWCAGRSPAAPGRPGPLEDVLLAEALHLQPRRNRGRPTRPRGGRGRGTALRRAWAIAIRSPCDERM